MFGYVSDDCRITCIITGEKWNQNTYIVTQSLSRNTIVVDPGDNADLIIQHLLDGCAKLTRILLTHPHHDHVGAASQISKHFDVACELHKQDVRLLMHAPMYALRFANKKIPSVSCFQQFEELSLSTAGPLIRSIHTPGHTKGSTCYLFDGFVFTGDTLLYKHVGRTDLPGSSSKEIAGSIEKLLNELSDEITIFPGHGKPWTIGEAKEWWQELQEMPAEHKSFIDELR